MKNAKLVVRMNLDRARRSSSCEMVLHYDNANETNVCVLMSSCAFVDENGPFKVNSKSEIEEFLTALQNAEIKFD
jgi:hypothetical protein